MHGTIGGNDLIELAIKHLLANGYAVITSAAMNELEAKVAKPRKARAAVEAPKLNAVGKPYGPGFDPKYKIKHKTPGAHVGNRVSTAASIKNMDQMRAHIAASWS